MSKDDYNYAPLGWCPVCGWPSKAREKRHEGDDVCEKAHWYYSDTAITNPDRAYERRVRFLARNRQKSPDQVDAPKAPDPGSTCTATGMVR